MNFKRATLNGIEGDGYAVITIVNGRRECRGEFRANTPFALVHLSDDVAADYSGVVYESSTEEQRTLRIHLGSTYSTQHGSTISFFASV